jgi:para-aminobenzoate synthetase component I
MLFQTQLQSINNRNLKYSIVNLFQKESSLVLLDGNTSNEDSFEWIVAAGAASHCTTNHINAFDKLQEFIDTHKDWAFGSMTYDLKNGIENLNSIHSDGIKAPALHFFIPKYLFIFKSNELEIRHHISQEPFNLDLLSHSFSIAGTGFNSVIKPKESKSEYIANVNQIKKHIQAGDVYEMNYCQEFYATNSELNPLAVFVKLNRISKAPYSCYYKHNSTFLLSASPERYLKKQNKTLCSQPIKGTRKRGATELEDAILKEELLNDQKERSENVMIVDLVRNDLSRIAVKNSVKVDELFGIYSFEQVHQMISTISCELKDACKLSDIFKATFPMGSMTGAPKIRAMQLIEKFEKTKRGLYSGAIGYIKPNGDFDFNVVIRSIQYNALNKYLSFMVGGAITIGSDAELEYQECLVKAKALFEVLEVKHAKTIS